MFRRRKTGITARDLGEYGNPITGDVDVAAAARDMGVSHAKIRDAIGKARSALSNTLMRGISGRDAADSSTTASPLGKLQAAFGRGPRGAAVNAREAAQKLGVSAATIRRWATGRQKPSPDHDKTLSTAARQATSTKAGRCALTADFRNSANGQAAIRNGGTLRIGGYQGPKRQPGRPVEGYCRDRMTSLAGLTPQHIEDMLAAYERGGDTGLHEWMTNAAAERTESGKPRYFDGWDYITIEDFQIEGNQ